MRLLISLFVATLLLSGCEKKKPPAQNTTTQNAKATASQTNGEPSPGSPRGVVTAYYDAIEANDLEAAYALVSSTDRAARPFEVFKLIGANEAQVALNAARDFSVNEAKIEGDTARVYVDMTGPDLPRIQRNILEEYINRGEEVPKPNALQELLIERMTADDAPRAKSSVEVLLVKEDEEWRLDFDWDKEKTDRPLPEKERLPTPKPDAGK